MEFQLRQFPRHPRPPPEQPADHANLRLWRYNNLGQRTGASRAGGAGASTSYGYDGAWRLNNLTHTFAVGANNQPSPNNQTIRLPSYSPAGQIFTRTSSNAAYNWTGSAALTRAYSSNSQNQMTASGTTALSYDTRGNLTGAVHADRSDRMWGRAMTADARIIS